MYGKFFASAFTGSMMGAGSATFAVWGYVIAHAVKSQVELNPRLLATVIGCTTEEVDEAIALLCKPDPNSRSKAESGRRLVKEGQFAYRVVNHDQYVAIRDEEARRESNRLWKRESRARLAGAQGDPDVSTVSTVSTVSNGQAMSGPSAHTDADGDTDSVRTSLGGTQANVVADDWKRKAEAARPQKRTTTKTHNYAPEFSELWSELSKVGRVGNSNKFEASLVWETVGRPSAATVVAAWAAYIATVPPDLTPKHVGRWLKVRGHEQDYPPASSRGGRGHAAPDPSTAVFLSNARRAATGAS